MSSPLPVARWLGPPHALGHVPGVGWDAGLTRTLAIGVCSIIVARGARGDTTDMGRPGRSRRARPDRR